MNGYIYKREYLTTLQHPPLSIILHIPQRFQYPSLGYLLDFPHNLYFCSHLISLYSHIIYCYHCIAGHRCPAACSRIILSTWTLLSVSVPIPASPIKDILTVSPPSPFYYTNCIITITLTNFANVIINFLIIAASIFYIFSKITYVLLCVNAYMFFNKQY